ncbi:MAG: D-alanine--D-alanine ligase, partial [Nitrospira sp.]|nr:D-alanine--D-alanine ligase [Nitrospira sp.]
MTPSSFTIGVLMGGQSAEREISMRTGQAVCLALRRRGYRAQLIDVDRNLPHRLRAKKVDVAFLALHGPGGEDGTVQGMLEVMGIPYTASGVSASAVGMDKGLTRVVLEAAGVP